MLSIPSRIHQNQDKQQENLGDLVSSFFNNFCYRILINSNLRRYENICYPLVVPTPRSNFSVVSLDLPPFPISFILALSSKYADRVCGGILVYPQNRLTVHLLQLHTWFWPHLFWFYLSLKALCAAFDPVSSLSVSSAKDQKAT